MQKRSVQGIVALAAIFVTATGRLWGSEELQERLKRIYDSPAFRAKRFGPARWIRGGAAYTTLENAPGVDGAQDIVEYDTASGKRSVLVSHTELTPKGAKALAIEDYTWDREAKRLLIYTASERVWRTNSRGDYWVLDRANGSLKKLGGGDAAPSSLMFAKFSPDGGRVAYVRANNLYVEDLAAGKVKALTSDGSEHLVNGASDWVYEEELNLRDGFRWSPDGKSLAFWQFDLTGVEQFALINNTDALYPKVTLIPYPKAGTKNSSVRVGVIGIEGGGQPRWVDVPGDPRNHYIFRMEWRADGRLAIGQLNRKQDTATVYLADPRTGAATVFFTDHDEAWVDLPEGSGVRLEELGAFHWMNHGARLLWTSERDGWRRAYAVPAASSGAPAGITAPGVDVLDIEGADREDRWIYVAASPQNATQRYLFRAPLDRPGGGLERLTPVDQPGTHSYHMSPDCRWAFHTYSRFGEPPVTDLISLPDHRRVRLLEGNAVLRSNVSGAAAAPTEFLKVTLQDGTVLDGWLMKPRNFDPAKKYPLIVQVYGEPASQTVRDAWGGSGYLFHRALADEGYLIASFDNRGTPAPKGRAWRKSIYGSVGVLSAQDQTQAVLALAAQHPFVDLTRVGVWGWSGGGSNTLNLMFRSPDVFRVGVSVAPVPDQKLYDTIYQERYMGLPEENVQGYHDGSPINFAEGLRGKLLIVHGSGDDNVHIQGTEKLVNRLIELGKTFDYMEYPNRTHAIAERKGTTLHVYRLIARYFEEHLRAG